MTNGNSAWLAAIFIVGSLMITGHFFPWPAWLRGPVINRLFCYTWGPSWVLFGAFLVAALTHRNYLPLAEVFILFAVAGIVTAGCYGYDYIRDINNRNKRREKANGQ